MERTGGAGVRNFFSDGSLILAPGRRRARDQRRRRGWAVAPLAIAFGVLAAIVASVWWLRTVEPAAAPAGTQRDEIPALSTLSPSPVEVLTDEKLQSAADQLLALSD